MAKEDKDDCKSRFCMDRRDDFVWKDGERGFQLELMRLPLSKPEIKDTIINLLVTILKSVTKNYLVIFSGELIDG
jgi:hypothetical protein